jgi:hypothetical protein
MVPPRVDRSNLVEALPSPQAKCGVNGPYVIASKQTEREREKKREKESAVRSMRRRHEGQHPMSWAEGALHVVAQWSLGAATN